MTARSKLILLVLLTQSGFLGMGAWMHQRFDTAAVHRAARDRAWADLETAAEAVVLAWREGIAGLEPGSDALGALRQSWAADEGHTGDLLLVDGQWRPMAPGPEDLVDPASPGSGALGWLPQSRPDPKDSDAMRGVLTLPDGMHLAAAFTLQDPPGFAVFHRPIAAIEAQATTMVGSRPTVSILIFAWTGVLMAIAVVAIMFRDHRRGDCELLSCRNMALVGLILFQLGSCAYSLYTGDHSNYLISSPVWTGFQFAVMAAIFIVLSLWSYRRGWLVTTLARHLPTTRAMPSDMALLFNAALLTVLAVVLRVERSPSVWWRGLRHAAVTASAFTMAIVIVQLVTDIMFFSTLIIRVGAIVDIFSHGSLIVAGLIVLVFGVLISGPLPPLAEYFVMVITFQPVFYELGLPPSITVFTAFYIGVLGAITPPMA
ncbi:MAG: hypothetical protein IID40_01605, partial [Planctomycetes bacterium]|nr:hypothetical protein [Planctomycetota bacterium]